MKLARVIWRQAYLQKSKRMRDNRAWRPVGMAANSLRRAPAESDVQKCQAVSKPANGMARFLRRHRARKPSSRRAPRSSMLVIRKRALIEPV